MEFEEEEERLRFMRIRNAGRLYRGDSMEDLIRVPRRTRRTPSMEREDRVRWDESPVRTVIRRSVSPPHRKRRKTDRDGRRKEGHRRKEHKARKTRNRRSRSRSPLRYFNL